MKGVGSDLKYSHNLPMPLYDNYVMNAVFTIYVQCHIDYGAIWIGGACNATDSLLLTIRLLLLDGAFSGSCNNIIDRN